MGVDVLLYAETSVTPERLAEAEDYFYVRSSVADRYEPEKGKGWLSLAVDDADWLTHPRVVANLTCRYWGPGYERGNWPGIYGAIRLLQHLFPEAKVYYDGDSSDDGLEVTDDLCDEYWAHWLGPNGDDYRARNRAWNAARKPAAAVTPPSQEVGSDG
jgi:hypothetical protein